MRKTIPGIQDLSVRKVLEKYGSLYYCTKTIAFEYI
jgi:hypothetical protein